MKRPSFVAKVLQNKVSSTKDTCSLLKLDGVKQPFVIPRPPAVEMRYAGILHHGPMPWVLYSEDRREDTRRKV